MEKGTATGLEDMNYRSIRMGDIVEMLGTRYEVVYERGAFGLVREDGEMLDWDQLDNAVFEVLNDDRTYFCRNDHFVSLWELSWNFGDEPDWMPCLMRVEMWKERSND